MKIKSFVAATMIAAFMVSGVAQAKPDNKEILNIVDELIGEIIQVADGFPPSIRSDDEKNVVLEKWKMAEASLLKLHNKDKSSYDYIIRLGDLYRMGHNLDINSADKNAVKYLNMAIKKGPKKLMPHVLLGKYYTFSNNLQDGEKEYLLAVPLAKDNEGRLEVYFGLANVYYFQRRFKESYDYANRFLIINPEHKGVEFIRDRAFEAMTGKIKPKIVKMD